MSVRPDHTIVWCRDKRGVDFHDPDGHLLEVITTPYGDELPS